VWGRQALHSTFAQRRSAHHRTRMVRPVTRASTIARG